MNKTAPTVPIQGVIPFVFLATLLYLGYLIMREFFLILAWSVIIAYITWPLYHWLKLKLDGKETLSAAVMTTFITGLVTLTLTWLAAMLQNEIRLAYRALLDSLGATGHLHLFEQLAEIPLLGPYLREWLEQLPGVDEGGLARQLLRWAQLWFGQFAQFLGQVGHHLMQLAFILVTVFFCFRDGEQMSAQLRQGLAHFLGAYRHLYLQAAGDTTRAVVYGIMMASLGQGVAAGIGYAVAGVPAPVLFGMITFLLALVPMGAMAVWISIGVSLLLAGEFLPGIGLLLWGTFVISTVDNIIRPIVISGASQVPFLVVMFGVFGGLTAFGVIGLFLGPVILSVLLAVWRAWLTQQAADQPGA